MNDQRFLACFVQSGVQAAPCIADRACPLAHSPSAELGETRWLTNLKQSQPSQPAIIQLERHVKLLTINALDTVATPATLSSGGNVPRKTLGIALKRTNQF